MQPIAVYAPFPDTQLSHADRSGPPGIDWHILVFVTGAAVWVWGVYFAFGACEHSFDVVQQETLQTLELGSENGPLHKVPDEHERPPCNEHAAKASRGIKRMASTIAPKIAILFILLVYQRWGAIGSSSIRQE